MCVEMVSHVSMLRNVCYSFEFPYDLLASIRVRINQVRTQLEITVLMAKNVNST